MSEIRRFNWVVKSQEGQRVQIVYSLEGSEIKYQCVLENVKADTTLELLNQQIKNAVVAHYQTYHRWTNQEGTFEADLAIKTVKNVSRKTNQQDTQETENRPD